jgi:hypothetical protein
VVFLVQRDNADTGGSRARYPWQRISVGLGELAAAPATRLRVVIDDLIDLILRAQLATRPPMRRLAARLTLFALPAHQLLGLGPRLSPPLRPRLRRIARWRLGTRARALTPLGL